MDQKEGEGERKDDGVERESKQRTHDGDSSSIDGGGVSGSDTKGSDTDGGGIVDGGASQPTMPAALDAATIFRCVGRLLAKALIDGQLVPSAHLTTPLYKLILGVPVTLADVAATAPDFYSSLNQVRGAPQPTW